LIKEWNDEECDATKLNESYVAGNIKISFNLLAERRCFRIINFVTPQLKTDKDV